MSGHHDHDHSGSANERRLLFAVVLTGLFMVAEAVGGILSGSLALLADAGHMLVDFAGLALALFAMRLARRPADDRRTYGYGRFQILAAFVNGMVLFLVAGWIVVEAVRRLANPVEILAGPMLAVAVAGLVVNIVAFLVLHGADREDLNMRGALLHVMGDLLGSVAAIGASLVIMASGWTPIDPILSVFVCLIILGNAWRLVRDSAHILLEGAPEGVEASEIAPALAKAVPGVREVHHVHVWALTAKRRAATLHAVLEPGADGTEVTRALKAELARAFRIDHSTVEIEAAGTCTDRECAGDEAAAHGHGHGHGHAHAHAGHNHHHHRAALPAGLSGATA